MNTETVRSNWAELKGKIKTRFGKLTDDGIESMHGDLNLLSGKLQSVYGYGKEQAEREFAAFKATLQAATEPEKKNPEKVEDTKNPPDHKTNR